MAYTKTTWNNLSDPPINAENLNKIEQGIYNNSLATDKINPSGTATTTAEIEAGQITDVIGFKSLKLKGQTSQYTTTGINLLPNNNTSGTINGVTFTKNEDGSILVNGKATSNAQYDMLLPSANVSISAGDYYLNGCPSGGTSETYRLVIGVDDTLYGEYGTGRAVTLSAGILKAYIWIANGTTVNNLLYKPMLVSGSTAKPYEKYTGGKASPNPDFPQDVNNVSGDNVIAINSKNIANPNDTFAGYPVGSNGSTITYTASANTTTYKKACYIEANQQYTLSWKINTPKSTGNRDIKIADENGKQLYNISYSNTNNVRTKTFTSPYSGYAYIALDANATELQVEKGSTATSYIAHQGNDFEINLSTNVVYSPRIWQNTSTVATQANRLFSTPQKLVKAGTYKLATTLDFTTYKYALEVGTTPYPFVSNLHDSGWKTTNNFSHTIPKGFVGIIVTRLDNANITVDEMKGVKFELRDTTLDDYDIELCKIGIHQDYIYKKDGKWWKHKAIEKIVLNGTTNSIASKSGNTANNTFISAVIPDILPPASNNAYIDLYCTHFRSGGTTNHIVTNNVLGIAVRMSKEFAIGVTLESPNNTVALMNTWLAENNVTVYYPRLTPIDEELTYTPLIRQLDELYNSGLYDVTNISQDNSSEAFILDLEACKNNINGIVEYIRR